VERSSRHDFREPSSSAIGNGFVDAYRQRDGNPWGGLSGVTNAIWTKARRGVEQEHRGYFANNPIVTDIINNSRVRPARPSAVSAALNGPPSDLSGPLALYQRDSAGPNKQEWNNFDTVILRPRKPILMVASFQRSV